MGLIDAGTSNKEIVVEPIVSNDYAVIVPHNRDKGGFGYAISPSWQNAYTLTEDELSLLLGVYTQLLKRHNSMEQEWMERNEGEGKMENKTNESEMNEMEMEIMNLQEKLDVTEMKLAETNRLKREAETLAGNLIKLLEHSRVVIE